MTGQKEWRLGRLVRERYVGLIISRWPEYRRTEWIATLYLGPVSLTGKVVVPS